ncbi:serine/threonine protein kinase [Planococcus salinarum]|uniref:serine/threonine protein kinase n=1 Tax=Planococcus salinarum TaxID=622695 RepID=UPI000E3BB17D|nr:serine/threonine protein kinase [Planococcus salinarum]TAA66475.1 hypothetical protein D2909_15345 [Planococcus salinarum]
MKSGLKLSNYLAVHYKEKARLKILQYNALDTELKEEMTEKGFTNFLGILTQKEYAAKLTDLYCEADTNLVYKNNADILILENATIEHVQKALRSRAEKIIIKPRNAMTLSAAIAGAAAYTVRGRKWDIHLNSFSDKNGEFYRALVLTRLHETEKGARRYLAPATGLENFFTSLNDRGIRYVVLRWFENLPFMDINEDVDVLVSDEDLEQVQNILDERIGILPFDVYSVTGMNGSSFRYVSYYPPYIAEKILNHREVWEGKYYVPDRLHYFLSLLYHVVYHKGEKSGIAFRADEGREDSHVDHDYPEILNRLAQENQIDLKEMNLDYLHSFLEMVGWAPATDTIRKLNTQNDAWLESIAGVNKLNFNKSGELMVFIIREWAVEHGHSEFILNYLEKAGLNKVAEVEYTSKQKKLAAQNLRGGNWGRGPWPVSGGVPSILLVMYDYNPKPLSKHYRKKYPYVTNEHYLLKEGLRKELNSSLPPEKRSNPIHSSDDEIEALDYIEATAPEILERVESTVVAWDAAYETAEKVIKDVSRHKRRAKVEIIEYQGKKVIKKTYKKGKERFLERELYVYGELSKECSFIPPLLDKGENYLIIPYYGSNFLTENGFIKNQYLRRYKEEIFEIITFFYDRGYAMIDFHPGNILFTKEGLKLIDFEFLYKYEAKPLHIEDSFDLNGFPEDFKADLPYEVEASKRRELWNKILY